MSAYLNILFYLIIEIIQQHEQLSYIVNNFIYTRPSQGIPAVIVNRTIYIFQHSIICIKNSTVVLHKVNEYNKSCYNSKILETHHTTQEVHICHGFHLHKSCLVSYTITISFYFMLFNTGKATSFFVTSRTFVFPLNLSTQFTLAAKNDKYITWKWPIIDEISIVYHRSIILTPCAFNKPLLPVYY